MSEPSPTDQTLLARWADARDDAAFAELVRRHAAMVFAVARRNVDPADVDDVAQATFLLLAQKVDAMRGHRNLGGWLFTTARLCASNARRTRGRAERRVRELAQREPAPAARDADAAEIAATLDDGIDRLSPALREVIVARFVEGHTAIEAADRLGVSPAAVAKRTERGLDQLRAFFKRRGFGVPGASTVATAALAVPVEATRVTAVATAITGNAVSPAAGALATAAGASLTTAVPLATGKLAILVAGGAAVLVAGVVGVVATSRPASQPVVASAPPASAPAVVPSTAPVAPAAAPAALPPSTAVASVELFLKRLRDADAPGLAEMLITDGGDAGRLAAAEALIRDVRNGPYARYPERLALGGGSSVMVAPDPAHLPADQRPLLKASFDTLSPIEAEPGSLTVRLIPVNGEWQVESAAYAAVGSAISFSRTDLWDGSSVPRLPREVASRATAAWDDLIHVDLPDVDRLTAAELPQLREVVVGYAAKTKAFAETLHGTPLWVSANSSAGATTQPTAETAVASDADVATLVAMTEQVTRAIDAGDLADVRETIKRVSSDARNEAATRRLSNAAEFARRSIDASDEIDAPVQRVPPFGSDVVLRVRWLDHGVRLRGPLHVPEWLPQTQAYKQWLEVGDSRAFRTRDDYGNVYEINVMGARRNDAGQRVPIYSTIRQYRPDGTLAATANWTMDGKYASEWGEFDATGKRYRFRAMQNPRGDDGKLIVHTIRFFDADGNVRWWMVDHGTIDVWAEQVADPIGRNERFIHLVHANGREDCDPNGFLSLEGLPIERE